jgi:hypothetical protein
MRKEERREIAATLVIAQLTMRDESAAEAQSVRTSPVAAPKVETQSGSERMETRAEADEWSERRRKHGSAHRGAVDVIDPAAIPNPKPPRAA